MSRPAAQWLVSALSRTVGAFRGRPRWGLRILLYHSVGGEAPGDHYGASVAVAAFEQHVRWLREESALPLVSLQAGVAALADGRLRGTTVAITFDDGYLDTLTIAAPLLARLGIPFTVFVVGGFLSRPPSSGLFLDATALRELAAMPGASVGAHGHTHRPLTGLGDADALEELRASGSAVAQVIGVRPTALSYPHGAVDGRVVRLAGLAGYTVGATSLLGVNRPRVPRLRLRRTEVRAGDSLAALIGKVRGDFDWYQVKQRFYWPVPAA